MKFRMLIAIASLATLATTTVAQEDFFTGRDVFANIMAKAKTEEWRKLPMGDLVGKVASQFIGTPYLGFTFEIFDDREVCVINLKGLDCATFYEASLALARTIKSGRQTEKEFEKEIKLIRYRGGKMNGYVSRLHYSTDYFLDNESKGIVDVISEDLPGAVVVTQKVGYMSQNPDKYRQLKANPDLIPKIAETEQRLNARKIFYVPKEKVADIEVLLKTGDLLGLTTKVQGLDVSHTGLCYRDENGVLRLLHASSAKKEVVLDERLSDFLAKSKVNTGIVVARPLER